MTRLDLVTRLVQCQGDIEALLTKLEDFPFDSEVPLVTLDASHITSVLERFLSGDKSAANVKRWAGIVAGRDDVGYAEADKVSIADALFVLAIPDINGELTPESAGDLLRQLRHEV
ncbi:MAG TPA: hypothetical protein VNX02_18985 [Steroidobacteraceae bacterium]|jgi:hypothetical protein|nr:hypothetical protein [Steroidobacteraceae bacterium]